MPRRKTAPPRGLLQTSATDPDRFKHARYHPSPDLERYVEHFWVVAWDLRGLAPYRAETLPHPSVHLVFEQGGRGRVAGVARGKFSTLLEGVGGVFATKFRPGGFYPFVRRPLVTLTDARVTLRSLWGARGNALEAGVLAEADLDTRVEIVENFLRELGPEPDANVTLSTTIVDAIAADRQILKVADVAGRFNLDPRKLQRLFARYIGVSPKWVIQRYRLHEGAEQLASGSARQSALALELGYSDQAHFVKDFKAIVGTSPAAYARRARGNR